MSSPAPRPKNGKLLYKQRITDPMWGPFPITALESEVLQTQPLARLEQIRQMGLAFLDYPSLTHTRLEHSLGVLFVADKLFKILRATARADLERKSPRPLRENDVTGLFDPKTHQAVRLAALLHDLGHPPFSHAVELTFKRYGHLIDRAEQAYGIRSDHKGYRTLFANYSHEAFTRWNIIHSENARDLRAAIRQEFDETYVKEIANLAVGEATSPRLAPFNSIISGDFDADRIDYLIRDNRRSGFAIGLSPEDLYDAVHLRRSTRRDQGTPYDIYVHKNAIAFVNSVLSARETLIRRVHLGPAGRSATQMLITFLFEDLNKEPDDEVLANTIVFLHERCTDFTFFEQLKRRLRSETASGRNLRSIEDLILRPTSKVVWPQWAHIDFMRMHPCLRLQIYLSATMKAEFPIRSMLQTAKGELLLIEPSCRPAPKCSLMVDFEPNLERRPGLDFVACTENRLGRAILHQSLAILDIYAYTIPPRFFSSFDSVEVPDRPDEEQPIQEEQLDQESAAEYTEGLDSRETLLAAFAARLVQRVRSTRLERGKGLTPPEFLLAVLYFLDLDVRRSFPGAHSVYVYRSEFFINIFMKNLSRLRRDEFASLYPFEFKAINRLRERASGANRIFAEIQRLAVFGLVETRQLAIYHSPDAAQAMSFHRTRQDVYSTHEDFRISEWGRHFVEHEMDPERLLRIQDVVEQRQSRIRSILNRMAQMRTSTLGASERFQLDLGSPRLEHLRRFHDRYRIECRKIAQLRGCAMVFRLPQTSN